VLAAIQAGQDTAYDLNKSADLSVGATLPLLARLENEHLLLGKAAARRSRQYSLTPKGCSVLNSGWRELVLTVPREFEAILRTAYVASIMDESLRITRSFLKAAAHERQKLAKQCGRIAESILVEPDPETFGRGHRWLRAHADSVRLREEAMLLARLGNRKDLAHLLLSGKA
jgi:DNA-binding PadR family transcriptional regulator